jgi:hypothetical protein
MCRNPGDSGDHGDAVFRLDGVRLRPLSPAGGRMVSPSPERTPGLSLTAADAIAITIARQVVSC